MFQLEYNSTMLTQLSGKIILDNFYNRDILQPKFLAAIGIQNIREDGYINTKFYVEKSLGVLISWNIFLTPFSDIEKTPVDKIRIRFLSSKLKITPLQKRQQIHGVRVYNIAILDVSLYTQNPRLQTLSQREIPDGYSNLMNTVKFVFDDFRG